MITSNKPLFLPLKTEYYRQFQSGIKRCELRKYGKRFNEKSCFHGRHIILSKGYGKHERMTGIIVSFDKKHGSEADDASRKAILEVYGTLELEIACIGVKIMSLGV